MVSVVIMMHLCSDGVLPVVHWSLSTRGRTVMPRLTHQAAADIDDDNDLTPVCPSSTATMACTACAPGHVTSTVGLVHQYALPADVRTHHPLNLIEAFANLHCLPRHMPGTLKVIVCQRFLR